LDEDDMKNMVIYFYFYRRLPKIEKMHIFSCDTVNRTDKKLKMAILESDFPGAKELQFNAIKQGFDGRSQNSKGQNSLKDAIRNRKRMMTETIIEIIETSGINSYKQVEMYDNYCPNIPEHCRAITRPQPSKTVLNMAKAEKEMQAEIKKWKSRQKEEILKGRRELDDDVSMKD
jgi:hypothetical protein